MIGRFCSLYFFCMLGAMRKTKKCEKYGILYGHLELRHSREALLEGCVEVDSPVFFRETSIVGTLCYSYLEFFAQCSSFFHYICWQVGRYLSEFQPLCSLDSSLKRYLKQMFSLVELLTFVPQSHSLCNLPFLAAPCKPSFFYNKKL